MKVGDYCGTGTPIPSLAPGLDPFLQNESLEKLLNFVADTSSIIFTNVKSTLFKRREHFRLGNGLKIGLSLLIKSI